MTSAAHPLRILIVGTGNMARTHADAFSRIDGVEIVGGVDQRPDVLTQFCDTFAIPNRFATLEEAIAWGEFDAAANVTPDAAHHPTTMALMTAGKHVLCEKPLATNADDAREMADLARAKKLIGMVNLSYRNVAVLQKAAELVAGGTIGALRHFEASYLQSWLTQPAWGTGRPRASALAPVERTRFQGRSRRCRHPYPRLRHLRRRSPVSELSCRLKTFDKAEGGRIGEYTLDANDSATLQAELENGALGTISATRFASGHLNDLRLRLYGDKGGLEVRFERHRRPAHLPGRRSFFCDLD